MGFDIAVDDAIGMGVFQGVADFYGNPYGRINGNMGMAVDVLLQGLPFHILHDDVMDIPVASHVVDAYDIGMGQLSGGLGFMTEPDNEVIVLCEIAVQNFNSHNPVEQDILGLVHIGHAA